MRFLGILAGWCICRGCLAQALYVQHGRRRFGAPLSVLNPLAKANRAPNVALWSEVTHMHTAVNYTFEIERTLVAA